MTEGFVEYLAEHRLRGWAFDKADPNRHLPVTVFVDGTLLGTVMASQPREDLRVAGLGRGDHGFNVAFRPPLPPALLDRITVWAGEPNARVALPLLPDSNRSLADQASSPTIPVADSEQYPVFVLGPARSGTSAVALALIKSGHYEGPGEGHLLPLVRELMTVIETYYARHQAELSGDTLLGTVHADGFRRMVRRGFIQLTRAAFPSGRWIDKTPTVEMVRSAPLLRRIWPNARFIFLKRRVIENLQSRRRKFPQEKLENHYGDWVGVLSAWLTVRKLLDDAAIEVDQIELARHTDDVAAKISGFLAMPPAAAEVFRAALFSDRPEQTSRAVGQIETIDDLALSTQERDALVTLCDPIMHAYGYSYDESYYRNGATATI